MELVAKLKEVLKDKDNAGAVKACFQLLECVLVVQHVCLSCVVACMYVCMHVCMLHVCMHVCMYVCAYACLYASMHVCIIVAKCWFKVSYILLSRGWADGGDFVINATRPRELEVGGAGKAYD